MRFLLALAAWSLMFPLTAQPVPGLVTPAAQRLAAFEQRQALRQNSPVAGLPFQNIGPSVQSGRVADIAVRPDDPTHFYVAYASGGLWKTTNNGTTFSPLFEQEAVMTLGALAVDWDHNTIWLGTGEVNASRSSYAGLGMYRSTDGGQTWQHRGLPESHHIGRIILHPDDPNTLWVAVLGHLYSPNRERGIYKTTDGGENWEQILYVNADAGGIEMLIDPDNPNHLYAATWERTRRAWDFTESGTGTGIYESSDGGENWNLISGPRGGFPNGEGAGRIGLALAKEGDESILYASIDNYFRRPEKDPEPHTLTKDELRKMDAAAFAQLPDYEIEDYLRGNGFPREFDVDKIREMIATGEITPLTLVEYTESANSLLFDTDVIGLEVYRTSNNGRQWEKTHEDYLDGVYNSYGYYFGILKVSPHDPDRLYALGVPVIRSDDGGTNWRGINGPNVHADHHALWINPDRPGHLILGNDGGINISYDDGESWIKCNHPPVGQFYAVAVDMAEPYRVYGGLQDNGVWVGPHDYEASAGWQSDGQYPYREIMGGDGMQVAIDPRDNETVYTGFQFGNYFRLNTRTGSRERITPQHELGERPYRWNWQSPIHLSEHNPDILYMASNFLHRSLNQGADWTTISPDLTNGGQKGDVPYGTLTTIHESPLRFGLLYTGSDDGKVFVSRDGGHSWRDISAGLPQEMWVSRVQAGRFEEGRVYLALNGYRWDNWSSMLYVSEDFGQSWNLLGRNLPAEPINVVREDPENEDLIYVGTDHGAYVSFDRGLNFTAFAGGLPAVPVHDLVIHPREGDIIIGTHGRSMYRGRGRELRQLDEALRAETLHLFTIADVRHGSRWGGSSWFREPFVPEVTIPLYAQSPGQANVTISVKDGPQVADFVAPLLRGLNYLSYDCVIDEKFLSEYDDFLSENLEEGAKPIVLEAAGDGKTYLEPGTYIIKVKTAGEERSETFEIKGR